MIRGYSGTCSSPLPQIVFQGVQEPVEERESRPVQYCNTNGRKISILIFQRFQVNK
jgi:hypothetical protein